MPPRSSRRAPVAIPVADVALSTLHTGSMPQSGDGAALDVCLLLEVLTDYKRGDFTVRLPLDATGVTGKVYDAVNDIIDTSERVFREVTCVAREVGTEGKLGGQAGVRGVAGTWKVLATLSHELRTPLNAILGWVHLLEGGQLDEATTRRAMAIIKNNAAIQRQLLDDILDVSRIVGGRMTLDITPVDPRDVIEHALDAIRPAAQARQTTIVSRLENGPPFPANRERLQQIVWNVLSNAVKFTPQGGRIEVELVRGDEDLRILVRDNGQGIAAEFLPYVFERFTQADSSASRRHGGVGLGMAIVRHLVELHGGTVSVESGGADQGATFIVTLPARAAAASPSGNDAQTPETARDNKQSAPVPCGAGPRVSEAPARGATVPRSNAATGPGSRPGA